MFENAGDTAVAALQPAAANDGSAADAVFRAMHGFFGQLWLTKFATGQVLADGSDAGVQGAKRMWAHGLRSFDAATVKAALHELSEAAGEYPPSLPQFIALCRSHQPRKATVLALPNRAPNGEAALAEREKLRALRADAAAHAGPLEGIPTLIAAVADALGCAGADEAAELRRMNALFERVPA